MHFDKLSCLEERWVFSISVNMIIKSPSDDKKHYNKIGTKYTRLIAKLIDWK